MSHSPGRRQKGFSQTIKREQFRRGEKQILHFIVTLVSIPHRLSLFYCNAKGICNAKKNTCVDFSYVKFIQPRVSSITISLRLGCFGGECGYRDLLPLLLLYLTIIRLSHVCTWYVQLGLPLRTATDINWGAMVAMRSTFWCTWLVWCDTECKFCFAIFSGDPSI